MRKSVWATLVVSALSFLPVAALADTMQIRFNGPNHPFYEGSSVSDATFSIDVGIDRVSGISFPGGTLYFTWEIFDPLTIAAGWGRALGIASGLAAINLTQQIPVGLAIGDPVQVSFSTVNFSSVTSSGDYLTWFDSSSIGEDAGSINKPTILMLGTALVGISSFARRRMRKPTSSEGTAFPGP